MYYKKKHWQWKLTFYYEITKSLKYIIIPYFTDYIWFWV